MSLFVLGGLSKAQVREALLLLWCVRPLLSIHSHFSIHETQTTTLRLRLVEEIIVPDPRHTTQAVPVFT